MLAQCRAKRPHAQVTFLRKCSMFSYGVVLLALFTLAPVNGQGGPSNQGIAQSSAASPTASSSSFVLADPNNDASAFSPPAEPSPIVPAAPLSQQQQQQSVAAPQFSDMATSGGGGGMEAQQSAPPLDQNQSAATKAGTGGYGAMMQSSDGQGSDSDTANDNNTPAQGPSSSSTRQQQSSEPPNTAKGRQFNQFAVPAAPLPEAGMMGAIGALGPAGPAVGTCPGGPSLNIECDPKRPWPQCPPQSYCYATNTVDIGPYFCCPVWSTYGAAWRPATPFYAYAPPPPPNWPEPMRMAAAPAPWGGGGPMRKERREQPFDNDEGAQTALTQSEQRKIVQVMNDWVERQKAVPSPPETDVNGAAAGTNNVTTTKATKSS